VIPRSLNRDALKAQITQRKTHAVQFQALASPKNNRRK